MIRVGKAAKAIPSIIAGIAIIYTISLFGGHSTPSSDNASVETGGTSHGQQVVAQERPIPPCKTDWRKCSDNEDIMNNYKGISRAQVSCKYKSNDASRYGSPKWPWLYFSRFMPGSDGPKKGVITLVDDDVMFQNQFGAYERTRAICTFDFNYDDVKDISIFPR